MIKVNMVVFSYFPADTRVLREAQALGRAGIAVDVICLKDKKETEVERFGNITAYRIMKGTAAKENVFKYFILSSLFGLLAFFKLIRLSFKNKYSLIQAHNMPDFLVFVGLFHKFAGIPIILDLHDLTVELFISKCKDKNIIVLLPLVRFLEGISCKFADVLITTSSGFRDSLIERGVPPEKITLVLNSADNHVFELPHKRTWKKIETGPALLYHGTVAKRFGLHIAIDAVAELREKMPETKLCIYGKYDPSYKAELQAQIKAKGLENNVTIGGFLGLSEIIEVINRSDFGVVPYLSDPFMNLALSTKIFEYVSMRMPVVASRLQSITSIFDDRSIMYFEPGNPNDLSKKIIEMCGNPEESRKYSEYASQAYSNISWPVMSERYIKTVNGLISGNAL